MIKNITGQLKSLIENHQIPSPKRITSIFLASFFGLSIAFLIFTRFGGLRYGLPYLYHADEPVNLSVSLDMLKNRDLNPGYFYYPSGFFYIQSGLLAGYYLLGEILGHFSTIQEFSAPNQVHLGMGYISKPSLILIGRVFSAILSIITVSLVYVSSRRLLKSRIAQTLSIVLASSSPYFVWASHFIMPDMLMTLCVTALIISCFSIIEKGETWDFILSGILLGLTASSKYNGGVFGCAILVANGFRSGLKGFLNRNVVISFSVAAFIILLFNPFIFMDFKSFYVDFSSIVGHYSTGNATRDMGNLGVSAIQYLKYLWENQSAFLLLSLASLPISIRSGSKKILMLNIVVFIYYLCISLMTINTKQTLLPLYPSLGFLAAYTIDRIVIYLSTAKTKTYLYQGIAILACTCLLGFQMWKAIQIPLNFLAPDSRETARIWINTYLPHDATIVLESYSPLIDDQQFAIRYIRRLIDQPGEWYESEGIDYVVSSEGMYGRFFNDLSLYQKEIDMYQSLYSNWQLIKSVDSGNFEIKIYRVHE